MFFSADELDQLKISSATGSHHVSFERAVNLPPKVTIPAQDWEEMCEAYSADLISEKAKGKVASVRTFDYQGRKYTVGSTRHGGPLGASCEAYQLIPLSCFHDECFTEPGWARETADRESGYLKMKVLSKGVQCVLASRTTFVRGLPTVKPLSLARAMEINENLRASGGWRALQFGDSTLEWKMYGGHPVAFYTSNTDPEETSATLLWKHGSEYKDFHVPPSQFRLLEAVCSDDSAIEESLVLDLLVSSGVTSPAQRVQASLF